MRLAAVVLLLSSSIVFADDPAGDSGSDSDSPQVEMKYDEIRDVGQVRIISSLGADECGEVIGFGLIYMTKGEPQSSKRLILQPTIGFTVDKDIDVGDFSNALKRKVSVPFLIDGKRGEWHGEFGTKVADCDIYSKTCTQQLSVHVTLTKADLQKLAKSKHVKLRPFDGIDCELNTTTKQVVARFLNEAPALK
jgi:hypothetical protein